MMNIRSKILVLFTALGVIILAGIISVALYTENMILQIEKNGCKAGSQNVKNFLKSQIDSSSNSSNAVTLWDEYLEAAQKNDIQWIKDNVLFYAKENSNMEFLLTLNPHGKVLCEINSPNSLKKLESKNLQLYQQLSKDVHVASDIIKTNQGFYIITIVPIVGSSDAQFKHPFGYTLYGRKINKKLLDQGESITGLSIKIGSTDGISESTKGFIDTNSTSMKLGEVTSSHEKEGIRTTFKDELKDNFGNSLGNVFVQILSTRGMIAVNGFLQGMVIVCILILIVLIICTFMINRIVIKPIRSTSLMMKDISQGKGDLTGQLKISTKDEMGEMAKYFNAFVNKTRCSIKEVYDSVFVLKNTANNMTGISDTMATSSAETSGKTSQISVMAKDISNGFIHMHNDMTSVENFISTAASSVRGISGTVTNLASTADQTSLSVKNSFSLVDEITNRIRISADEAKNVSKSVNTVAISVKEINLSLNEVSTNCNNSKKITHDAKNKAQETNEIINTLNNSSREIGKIIDVIKNIADQTNMLALNAAIEAAGAGEAGKGFGVVANEVKELARQTGEATEEIGNKIDNMREQMQKAVGAVSTITSVIDEINIITYTIASAVIEQSATINEISKSMLDTTEKVKNITTDIEDVSQKAKAVAQSSEESAKAVNLIAHSTTELSNSSITVVKDTESATAIIRNISTKSQELLKQVIEILKYIEDINASSEEVTAGAEETNEVAKMLVILARSLERLVSQFKV